MGQVNFQCGHCGNLMGVLDHLLGQQVRCPHCQQVVRVPASAAAPPPPPPPMFDSPLPGAQEDIFSPPEASDEDLFGGSVAPRIELPPEPTWAPPPPEFVAPAPTPPLEPTLSYLPQPGGTATDNRLTEAPGNGLGTLTAPAPEGAGATEPAPDLGLSQMTAPAVARARKGGGSWLVPVLIVPLLLYSILATIAVVYLLALGGLRPQRHPFEMLPDQGEKPGASHVKIDFGNMPLLPVPPELRVGLGQSLTVGDLKVTPQSAELRRVLLRTAGFAKPEESADDALCVALELENVSRDVAFRPLDAYFFRKWTSKFESDVPFTYLEAGSKRFYGGACEGILSRKDVNRVVVDGQNYEQELRPGEKTKTFVCTDPDAQVGKFLAGYRGPLLYRLRVRRGLVPFRNKEVSATAVIGIDFSSQDVAVAPPPAG